MTDRDDQKPNAGGSRHYRVDFLQEWRVGVGAYDTNLRMALEGANDFAQTVLRSAFVLNGGGLILLPVYAKSVFGNAGPDPTSLVAPAVLFVLGLGFAFLAAMAAHFTMVFLGLALSAGADKVAAGLNKSWYPEEAGTRPNGDRNTKALAKEETANNEKSEKNNFKLVEITRWVGVTLAAASFIAFVAGTYLGAALVLNGDVG